MSSVTGTWPDKKTGVIHIAAGTLLNISAPSRWSTRTRCGVTVYDCPDTSGIDVVTCIRCLGAIKAQEAVRLQANLATIRGLKADYVVIDEAKDMDPSVIIDLMLPSGSP